MQNLQGIVNLRDALGPSSSNEEFHKKTSLSAKIKPFFVRRELVGLEFCVFGWQQLASEFSPMAPYGTKYFVKDGSRSFSARVLNKKREK